MTISGIASNSPLIQSILGLNRQLDDLQRQLSSGEKSDNYAGLGAQSGITVGLNSQLAALNSFEDTINNVSTRVQLMQTALGRVGDIAQSVKGVVTQANY